MQQMFPAGMAQRIVISDVDGDLFVHGWEQQTIQVKTDGRIGQLQPEGDPLTIRNCDDSLDLQVPLETVIGARNIKGGVVIENVRQVEIDVIGGDVSIKKISGNVTLAKIDGDATLTSLGGELELTDIKGGLAVKQTASAHIRGRIGDDAAFSAVAHADIERVDGDLVLEDAGEVSVKQVGGDLYAKNGIAVLQGGNVGGDCQVQGDSNAEVILQNVGGDLAINGASRFQVSNAGGDCLIQGSANAEGMISNVGGDLKVIGAARLQIGNVGSDCDLRDVQGNVSLSHVGSDATVLGVAGDLYVGNIGSDAHVRGIGGSISMGNIGSDLHLVGAFPADSEARVSVGGDAHITLPQNANLTIRARVGGDVTGHSIVSNFAGNFVNLVYGEGAARLELNVGGDLELLSDENPRSSSSMGKNAGTWSAFGSDFDREMSDLGHEMEQLGRNLGRDISATVRDATSYIGPNIASNIAAAREQARRAQREGEEQRRRAQRERQRAEREGRRTEERDPYFNVRINDREWKMGPERIEAIVEQARRAAADGVQGALEAVEQALSNIHVDVPPVPPAPPRPGTPPPPVSPTPGEPPASPAASSTFTPFDAPANSVPIDVDTNTGQTAQDGPGEHPLTRSEPSVKPANLDQEREAILRMIAEGRISPEEGDLLLEALGS